MIKLIRLLTFFMASLVASPGWAVEPLSAQELETYCSQYRTASEAAEGRLCIAYITGFLDGAIATDARVAENVINELDQGETFSERAVRTRVTRRLRDYGPSAYAEFCIGMPVPISDVVNDIVHEFDNHKNLLDVSANAIVYKEQYFLS